MRLYPLVLLLALLYGVASLPAQPVGGTTLSDPSISFTRPPKPYVILKRGDVEAVIVDNSAVKDEVLPDHRAGYSGLALLRHRARKENLFVSRYSGLNFEHIISGVASTDNKIQFEPRNHPMELRIIHEHAVELCQTPTFHHGLESCQRYELLEDGVIQFTVEVSPRKATFPNGYINLFWASYINQPESMDIHFQGLPAKASPAQVSSWVRGVTPAHGELSTHPAVDDQREFPHDQPFPLILVFSLSDYRYTQPWYYAVSHGMAFVHMFRPKDRVRFSQSPSGGGIGNPAWDFQFFAENPQVDQVYQFVMRAAYLPYSSPEQIEEATRTHRSALAR